jgi:hypothetical protein
VLTTSIALPRGSFLHPPFACGPAAPAIVKRSHESWKHISLREPGEAHGLDEGWARRDVEFAADLYLHHVRGVFAGVSGSLEAKFPRYTGISQWDIMEDLVAAVRIAFAAQAELAEEEEQPAQEAAVIQDDEAELAAPPSAYTAEEERDYMVKIYLSQEELLSITSSRPKPVNLGIYSRTTKNEDRLEKGHRQYDLYWQELEALNELRLTKGEAGEDVPKKCEKTGWVEKAVRMGAVLGAGLDFGAEDAGDEEAEDAGVDAEEDWDAGEDMVEKDGDNE